MHRSSGNPFLAPSALDRVKGSGFRTDPYEGEWLKKWPSLIKGVEAVYVPQAQMP